MQSEEFEQQGQYRMGQMGESIFSRFIRSHGGFVLPAYDIEIETGKGPRLFGPDGSLVTPDMFAIFPYGRHSLFGEPAVFTEAKTKTAFTPRRNPNRDGFRGILQTGCDEYHFLQYVQVQKQTGIPVWLGFIQLGGQAKDGPLNTPSGLWAQSVSKLIELIDHRHPDPPPRYKPMVYWNRYDLRKLATLEELLALGDSDRRADMNANKFQEIAGRCDAGKRSQHRTGTGEPPDFGTVVWESGSPAF